MTAATAGGVKRPPITLEVKDDEGGEITIKLTYGLFQDLQRLVPDAGAIVDTITADPYTRDYIIRRCLTPVKKIVKDMDKELVAAEDLTVNDPEQIESILQWVAEHLLYFFAISAGKLQRSAEAFTTALKPTADQPAPSKTGSQS